MSGGFRWRHFQGDGGSQKRKGKRQRRTRRGDTKSRGAGRQVLSSSMCIVYILQFTSHLG